MKSNKLGSIVAIVSILLVSLISGILAYLQDTEEVTNVFTIGKVDIQIIEKTTGDADYSTITTDTITVNGNSVNGIANLVSGEEIAKKPSVKNIGKNPAYVYLEVKVPMITSGGEKIPFFTYTTNSGWTEVAVKEATIDNIEYKVYRYQYNTALAVNESTTNIFDSIKVTDATITPEDLQGIADVQFVKVNGYAIQTNGLTLAQGYNKFFPIQKVEEITVANYGQYVDLGTSILPKTDGVITQKLEGDEQPLADWRVFHKDSNGTWLILADYMPNSSFDVTSVGLEKCTTYPTYGVISHTSRKAVFNGLEHSDWSNLIAESSVTGISGVQVKGAIGLDTWKESWNLNTGYTTLYTDTYSNKNSGNMMADGLDGYYIGNTENPTSTSYNLSSDTNGYGDTLYFPHKSGVSNGYAYCLDAVSAHGTEYVMVVRCNGYVNGYGYSTIGYDVRPAVYLPNKIKLNTTNEVWTIDTTSPTVADISVENYGQYVNLNTNILDLANVTLEDGTHPLSDWRVFGKDDNGAWLILSDYMPNNSFDVSTVGLAAGENDEALYGVCSVFWSETPRRISLLNGLNNSNWNNLISGSSISGVNGVVVKGGMDIETWVKSWNESYESDTLYIRYLDSDDPDITNNWMFQCEGYAIGDSTPVNQGYVDLSSKTGYNNTLYFTHKNYDLAGVYWLASLSAEADDGLCAVSFMGGVHRQDDNPYAGVRPVVYIPNSIKLDMDGTVWEVVN